ncbi:MAG: hypothetical protein ACLFQ8_02770 [Candidatus Aenigmatarchaeota archaeon]
MKDKDLGHISEEYVGEEGLYRGTLRYDGESKKFYFNESDSRSAEVVRLNESDYEEVYKDLEDDKTKGIDVLIDGKLDVLRNRKGLKYCISYFDSIRVLLEE